MKTFSIALVLVLAAASNGIAQDKKEIKKLETQYAAFTGHKAFYKSSKWVECKFSVVYKLTSSMTAQDTEKKNTSVGKIKNKTSSGAYAVLNGLSEQDLQNITNKVGDTFVKRMREEAGVEIITWDQVKDNENTKKIKEAAEDKELYSASQGLAYATTYKDAIHYNRVIVLVPNGKKLAKDLDAAVSEVTLIIDFAEMLAKAEASVKYSGTRGNYVTYILEENHEKEMSPGVRIVPKIGSQATLEAATDIQGTTVRAHDANGYMYSVGLLNDIVSTVNYVESAEESNGTIPEVLANRRNNKIESTTTWNINTTPELYEMAVLDAFNQYLDVVIKLYNFNKG